MKPKRKRKKRQVQKSRSTQTIKKQYKSKSKKKRKIKKRQDFLKHISLSIGITGLLVLLLSWFWLAFPKVEGYSMTNTLHDGDRLVVNKQSGYRRYDLVYFRLPNKKERSVRRIIGFPGERVEYREDTLFINGEEKVERYLLTAINEAKKDGQVFTADFSLQDIIGEQKIPAGKYLVLGDNRPYATDSRYYGLIDEKDIIGVVEMRIFPLHKLNSF